MKKIYLIIPFINCESYTFNLIKTLKSEHFLHILLIDNNSDEEQRESLKSELIDYLEYNPNMDITYIFNQTRKSVAESWNQGIMYANEDPNCEYILISNNDALYHPKTINNLVRFIDRTGYAMVTATNVNDGTRKPIDIFEMEVPDFNDDDLKPITNWREEGPDFSCFMIKCSFIKEHGLIDENFRPAYFEDNDMHTRLVKAGCHAKRISTAPYFHYGSVTTKENSLLEVNNKSFETNRDYFKLKWGAMPSDVLDGQGYDKPFNKSQLPLWYWPGTDKYFKDL